MAELYKKYRPKKLKQVREKLFWNKVNIGGPFECWEWKAYTYPNGYGYFRDGKRKLGAHVFSYELHNGTIPEGMLVLHECDNPPCVNPGHLFLGTNKRNSEDMVQKGRSARGERQHSAKLTEDDILDIRAIYNQGGISYHNIALMFGVSLQNVRYIVIGRTWRHV